MNRSRRAFIATAGAVLAARGLLARGLAGLAPPELSLPPLLARPTASSILIHARNGPSDARARLELFLSGTGDRVRQADVRRAMPEDFLEWSIDGLKPGTRYEYRLHLEGTGAPDAVAARGDFVTQRVGDEPFLAAIVTDPHTGTFAEGSPQVEVMDDVIRNVTRDNPEFVIALGDNVAWTTSRGQPQESGEGAERAYAMYRRHMGPLTSRSSHFSALGNWDGETGKFPQESVGLVRVARHRFLPNPDHRTYAQGGSAGQDYYAFTWGPALFVILNVQSYTNASTLLVLPTVGDVARVEDWTLGPAQLAWLEKTLEASTSSFAFLCIHHAVGGNGGNNRESLYGRGGARAAGVGEQRIVHQLMRGHGVQIFFYGHDHVFVDDVVDGIHYTLPGSFGAPWHFAPAVTGYSRFWTASGHARLHVSPKEAKVEFVDQAGSVIHAFTVEPR